MKLLYFKTCLGSRNSTPFQISDNSTKKELKRVQISNNNINFISKVKKNSHKNIKKVIKTTIAKV